MYPDGGVVDVFVLDRSGRPTVTDFGEALGWLRMQSIRGRLSPKQRRMIEDVCLTLGVEFFRGQIVLRCDDPADVGKAVLRVGQVAVRLSDLWFTFRTRMVETVSDEVSDWLGEMNIPYIRRFGKPADSGEHGPSTSRRGPRNGPRWCFC